MDKEMEHEMESGMLEGVYRLFIGIRGLPKLGVSFLGGPHNKDNAVVV